MLIEVLDHPKPVRVLFATHIVPLQTLDSAATAAAVAATDPNACHTTFFVPNVFHPQRRIFLEKSLEPRKVRLPARPQPKLNPLNPFYIDLIGPFRRVLKFFHVKTTHIFFRACDGHTIPAVIRHFYSLLEEGFYIRNPKIL